MLIGDVQIRVQARDRASSLTHWLRLANLGISGDSETDLNQPEIAGDPSSLSLGRFPDWIESENRKQQNRRLLPDSCNGVHIVDGVNCRFVNAYKASTIVIYDSRVVPDLKISHITTLDS